MSLRATEFEDVILIPTLQGLKSGKVQHHRAAIGQQSRAPLNHSLLGIVIGLVPGQGERLDGGVLVRAVNTPESVSVAARDAVVRRRGAADDRVQIREAIADAVDRARKAIRAAQAGEQSLASRCVGRHIHGVVVALPVETAGEHSIVVEGQCIVVGARQNSVRLRTRQGEGIGGRAAGEFLVTGKVERAPARRVGVRAVDAPLAGIVQAGQMIGCAADAGVERGDILETVGDSRIRTVKAGLRAIAGQQGCARGAKARKIERIGPALTVEIPGYAGAVRQIEGIIARAADEGLHAAAGVRNGVGGVADVEGCRLQVER